MNSKTKIITSQWELVIFEESVKEYLNETKPSLRDITINLQKSNTWKLQLVIAINLISSKDALKKTKTKKITKKRQYGIYNLW